MRSSQQQQLEQQVDQLVSRHVTRLSRLTSSELRNLANRFDDSRGCKRSRGRICLTWTGRLLLCLLAAVTLTVTLSQELVVSGYATQSTGWLAASDLALQKLVRRVSHSLRLYDTDWGRGMKSCLLANPFSKAKPLCCGCQHSAIVKVPVSRANQTRVADLIDSLYNRAVKPFLVIGDPAKARPDGVEVDFARLASFVAENRQEFERGGNYFKTLPELNDSGEVVDGSTSDSANHRRFDDVFPAKDRGASSGEADVAPPGQVLMWSFYHLSAVRALRRLVPRPPYFGQRTERTGAVSLLLAGRSLPPGRLFSAGDFAETRQLAFALPLSGRLTARLAPKAACCDGAKPPPRSEPIDLAPGRTLFFLTDCHELLVGRPTETDGAAAGDDWEALVQIGFIYNGAHPAKRKKN